MFGRERDQPGVLVELDPDFAVDVDDNQEVIKARNLVWSVVFSCIGNLLMRKL